MAKFFSLAEMLQGSLFKLSLECEEIPMLEVFSQISKKESKAQLLRMSYYEKKHFI